MSEGEHLPSLTLRAPKERGQHLPSLTLQAPRRTSLPSRLSHAQGEQAASQGPRSQ